MLNIMLNRNCCQTIMLFICNFVLNNSLHVVYNFIKTVLLECINERYQSIPWLFYWSISIVHYNFQQMLDIAINIYCTLPYYAGIMLNAFNDLLCSKLCWHNRRIPRYWTIYHNWANVYRSLANNDAWETVPNDHIIPIMLGVALALNYISS